MLVEMERGSCRIFRPAFTAAMDRAWDRWWSDATRLATSFSRCNPIWCLSMGLRQGSGLPVRYVTKTWSVLLLNKKIHILLSQVYCVWQVVKTPTVILNNPVHAQLQWFVFIVITTTAKEHLSSIISLYTNQCFDGFITIHSWAYINLVTRQPYLLYRGADKSLDRRGRKQATTTADFEFHISYL